MSQYGTRGHIHFVQALKRRETEGPKCPPRMGMTTSPIETKAQEDGRIQQHTLPVQDVYFLILCRLNRTLRRRSCVIIDRYRCLHCTTVQTRRCTVGKFLDYTFTCVAKGAFSSTSKTCSGPTVGVSIHTVCMTSAKQV